MSTGHSLLVRFLSRTQVIELYGIAEGEQCEFFEECPVAWRRDGEPVFRESDVDEYARWFRCPPYQHPSRRRGGNPSRNGGLVAFADQRRKLGDSWKEVAAQLNKHHPKTNGRWNAESVRKIVERHRLSQL